MPRNHVLTSSSFLCSPSNVGGLILFISPFSSSTPDLLWFLVGDGLQLLCALLLERPWEWWWCLPTLLDLLPSKVRWLSVLYESLNLSNLFSILSRLFINFKLNSPCLSWAFCYLFGEFGHLSPIFQWSSSYALPYLSLLHVYWSSTLQLPN